MINIDNKTRQLTLEQIKDEVAKENSYDNWDDLMYRGAPSDEIVNEIAKRYAQQVAEDVRASCAKNATARHITVKGLHFAGCGVEVNKDSILNTKIILP